MEASVEARLQFLEERVRTLEALVGAESAPTAVPPPPPPVVLEPMRDDAAWELEQTASPPPSQPLDLEELLGGRVLGWVGGIAVVIAAVFFVVMAVHNGWIGVAARMELAFAASLALVVFGAWLHERRGSLQAARATVAAGLASLYASDAATTLHYHLLSSSVGLVIAGAVGALALVTGVRWSSQEIAAIGIVGSLLAPVLVDAGVHTNSLIFMTIALLAAIVVVLHRRWVWLAVVAYIVSVPQAAAWLVSEHTSQLGLTVGVAVAFWLLYVVAALGHELRAPTAALRLSSASLLFANASVTAAGGYWLIRDASHGSGAHMWLFALAAAHILLGTLLLQSRASREIALLLYGVAAALVGVAVALVLHGPALVAAWSFEAALLAWFGRLTETPRRGLVAAFVFAGLAGAHTLVTEAPPKALAYGLPSIPSALGAVLLVIAALAVVALAYEEVAERLAWIGAATGVYLLSALVVGLAGASEQHTTQTSQLVLSGFWAALGFAAIVAGLIENRRALRVGGLGVLALAVGKVFIVDLAHLESIWRVGSFLALGLLLLAGAFAYQRGSRTAERGA